VSIPKSAQEILRVHPVGTEIVRVATKDDVLPLTKPVVGISGKVYKELPVSAGTPVFISTIGYNLYVRPLSSGTAWIEVYSSFYLYSFTAIRICGDPMPMNSDQNDGSG